MSVFRRVEAQQAGANALGILVPPGTRTVVVVRCKALAIDLLPAQWNGDPKCAPVFGHFTRDEAAILARRFIQSLEEAVHDRRDPVESFGDEGRGQLQIWVRAAEYFWIACRAAPGKTYVPILFASRQEGEEAGERLTRLVHPGAEAGQEYYFNTQKFGA